MSAGGNIALVLAHLAHDANIPLKLVAVGTPLWTISRHYLYDGTRIRPHTELGAAWMIRYLEWSSLSSDPVINEKQMKEVSWFADLMQAPSFKGLSKTVTCTAGCDPLRDEGEAYARKLVEVGTRLR